MHVSVAVLGLHGGLSCPLSGTCLLLYNVLVITYHQGTEYFVLFATQGRALTVTAVCGHEHVREEHHRSEVRRYVYTRAWTLFLERYVLYVRMIYNRV